MSARNPTFSSLTRISDLPDRPFDLMTINRAHWATGDYVVGKVTGTSRSSKIELPTGRMTEVALGDQLVGAFGIRAATLEAVGGWQEIQADNHMQAMTAAGIFGRVTSSSTFITKPIDVTYLGHVVRSGKKVSMQDFVGNTDKSKLDCPVLLLIGTSMSSGKTTSAKVIIRRLKRMGVRVVGAKLTGAGRYRDILAMSDAGADEIFDFVDVGLPSTVCDKPTYRTALHTLLCRIADARPDVLVAEAGASPLEPYNGDVAVSELGDLVRCTVLCASDPYAVVGVTRGFGFDPDLVSGVATSTSAGVEIIHQLAQRPALNLMDPNSHPTLDQLLRDRLKI
ncbi:MAG: hypothetical protein HKN47_22595 [Pirellulaceae bacterium]|nr:hypothetical protein [Pirellulaceae bacterium]